MNGTQNASAEAPIAPQDGDEKEVFAMSMSEDALINRLEGEEKHAG